MKERPTTPQDERPDSPEGSSPSPTAPAPPNLAALVEGLLFVAEEPVSLKRLAQVLEAPPEAVEAALQELEITYRERGLRVQRVKDRVQLVTAPSLAAYVERFLGLERRGRLSQAALETLSIIAYRQPITRAQIEAIRGVNSDGVRRTLLRKGLIEEVGRADTIGRPILYGTTFAFLQYFGLESLDDLPPLPETISEGVQGDQPSAPPGRLGSPRQRSEDRSE